MKYSVKEAKVYHGGTTNDVYKVFSPQLESADDWVYEPYLLGIKDSDNIVDDFWNSLTEKFPSKVIFERDALIDSKRKCYTGMSLINLYFVDMGTAKEYASLLNKALEKLGE